MDTPPGKPIMKKQPGIKSILNDAARITDLLLKLNIVIAGVVSVVLILSALQLGYFQLWVLAAGFSIATLVAIAVVSPIFSTIAQRSFVAILNLHFLVLLVAIFVQDVGWLGVFVTLTFTLVLTSISISPNQRDLLMIETIIISVITPLVNIFPPFTQVAITWAPPAMGAIAITFFIVYAYLQIRGIAVTTLRTTILVLAVMLVIIPLVILSLLQLNSIQQRVREQTEEALKIASEFTARSLDDFFDSNINQILLDASSPTVIEFLKLPDNVIDPNVQIRINALVGAFRTSNVKYLTSLAILDDQGKILVDANLSYPDINSKLVGTYEKDYPHFAEPLISKQPYISSVEFDPRDNRPYIFISAPVLDSREQVIGVIRARYNAELLQDLMRKNINLAGANSYPILFDYNLIRLADPVDPLLIYKAISPLSNDMINSLKAQRLLPLSVPNEELSLNLAEFASYVRRAKDQPLFDTEMSRFRGGKEERVREVFYTSQISRTRWYLAYGQEQTSIEAIFAEQRNNAIVSNTLVAGIVGIIAIFVARSLSRPITELTEVAQKVTEGNLDVRAEIKSRNELGILGSAINEMTSRLQNFIGTLEATVSARTRELAEQNRELLLTTRQLQTVSEVARSITMAQQLETFLENITSLISERFNFYHVGIFLIEGEYAILRAANSPGGKKMLARQHMLKVGQVGIVGYVTQSGLPRVALNVGEDAVFFNNPDLPTTRSEMALPLRIGGRIIGALDVQSEIENAFSEKDVTVFSTLADQIAIAIDNNRLLAETAAALKEAEDTHRQYLQQEWSREIEQREHTSYVYTPIGVIAQSQMTSQEIQNQIDRGEMVLHISDPNPITGNITSTLAIPVLLGGRTIGMIQLQEVGLQRREWSEDEVTAVRAVADQVSQAMERARLFEKTLRRADRERKALEITSKIRATTDAQRMIEIAVEELQKALQASKTQIIVQDINPTVSGEKSGGNGREPSSTEA